MVAEGRKLNSCLSDELEHILLAVDYHRDSIYIHEFSFDHNYASFTAPNLQVEIQEPQRMHFSRSIWKGSLIFPLIAFTGHFLEHAEQPLHRRGSM